MGKFIVIGCGGVGKTFLEMLIVSKFHPNKYDKHIVIIEPKDLSKEPVIELLLNHKYKVDIIRIEVLKSNVDKLLVNYVGNGDIVVDASYNVSFEPLITHCFKVSAHYINTSLERWEMKDEENLDQDYHDRVLHTMHVCVRDLHKTHLLVNKKPSTVIVTHGMNPGLITHFTCTAITNIAERIFAIAKKQSTKTTLLKQLATAYKSKNYAMMAYIMSLRTVHCSERDTQLPKFDRPKDTFMNTWGPYSFYSEGVDPVQLGWGTHEDPALKLFIKHNIKVNTPKYGEQNQIYPHIRGVDLLLKSYVPIVNDRGKLTNKSGNIIGMAISHSENDTANQYLSLYEDNQLIYRPSNYYVYSPCKDAWDSLADVRKEYSIKITNIEKDSGRQVVPAAKATVKKNKYAMLGNQLALRGSDIKSGEDAVGSLLIFSCDPIKKVLYGEFDTKCTSFWAGTILNINQTKKLGFKYAGPTTIQVGISLINAIKWMLANPKQGLCFPEDLPHEKIIADSAKYLGTVFMDFVPYNPDTADLGAFFNRVVK